jgi:hypothetical protein
MHRSLVAAVCNSAEFHWRTFQIPYVHECVLVRVRALVWCCVYVYANQEVNIQEIYIRQSRNENFSAFSGHFHAQALHLKAYPNLEEPPAAKRSPGFDRKDDQAAKSKSGHEATLARSAAHMDLLQSQEALKHPAWHCPRRL